MDPATKQEILDAIRAGDYPAITRIVPGLAPFINVIYDENPEEPYTLLDIALRKADSRGLTDEQRDTADDIVEFMASQGALSARFLSGEGDMNALNAEFEARAALENAAAAGAGGAGGAAAAAPMTGAQVANMLGARLAAVRGAPVDPAAPPPLTQAEIAEINALALRASGRAASAAMVRQGRNRMQTGERILEDRQARRQVITPLGQSLAASGIAGNGRTRARVRLGGKRKSRKSRKYRKSRKSRK